MSDFILAQSEWLTGFQQLVKYYVQPLEPTPTLTAGSLIAVAAGILMALRSAKLLRWVVTGFGVIVGTLIGIEVSKWVGTPRPITAAACAVVISVLAYRTYKAWLAFGSIVALFVAAMCYQVGQGDLTRYLTEAGKVSEVKLATAAEQIKNTEGDPLDLLKKLGTRLEVELKTLGPRGWIVPVVGAIVGGMLAWKVLTLFAVVWMGLAGSVLAGLGGATFVSSHWPSLHASLVERPQILAGAILALWVAGMILQAKESRIPAKQSDDAKPDAAKAKS